MDTIVITGGSRGIGAATARECARRGLGVILTYKSQQQAAAKVVDAIRDDGGRAAALPLDVTDVASFAAFRDATQQALNALGGDLAGLVNNAGQGLFNPIETVTEAQFDILMNVHLKGPFFVTQALLPLMRDGASIVNLTSATTRVATKGVAPYAAFKGGLEVLTRYMAKEFGERRLRVNAVSPGPIRTDLGGGIAPDFESLLASQTALGRIGEPLEVARVIATLLTEDGGWINGQSIEVGGGYMI
ncbi:short-chain dehydrogenase [Alcanivorax sp. 521-1]|uniref:Short-chain dehydrogenase n=1 Tax=Alloalcanivorax profundimaris TaxID=2735259 RepID=A0ABS0AL20_9GAMM|nr:SDR family oxidoreductase [Alloalcanivorax profundimaris]MBF5054750.1 short-chain dehydrogenase [Alloalcanivorax profundimaris]QJX02851.1 SDR family oxidoreductase [Alcanivorax sp. IO_7]